MTKIASKIRNIFIIEEKKTKEAETAKQKAERLLDYLESCIEKIEKPKLKKQKV